MRVRILLAILLSLVDLAASPSAAAAEKVPQWLTIEASRALPSLPSETEAVVLLREQTTTVDPKGAIVTSGRLAIKVLRPGGAKQASGLALANSFDTKVRSMTGWVINPGADPKKVTMKQAIQTSLAPDTLFVDAKAFVLVVPGVDTGSVVGFEWEEVRTPPSLEDVCEFQGRSPVLRARYSLTLPADWDAELHWVNWKPAAAAVDPAAPLTRTFEILDVPAIGDEPYMPNDRALAGRLIVRLKTPVADPRSFAGWPDMGAWYERLSRDRRVPDEAVSQKARELTAGSSDALAKLRALAEFVQRDIRYVAIQIGIGGFQPHTASGILANRYGDCKDKATLLAAFLESLGLKSYYLIVHTDRGGVTMESPVSLYCFNHAILAIRLPDDMPDAGLDSLIRHPRLGRLLVFDPTMPTTPLGRLPYYLQDNTALLVADGGGELIRLPSPSPESNRLDRKGHLVLTNDGTLSGEIQETRSGSLADIVRYRMQTYSEAERRGYLETLLSRSLASFSLQSFEIRNLDSASSDLLISYRFIAPAYAKRAGGMLVVRPRILGNKAIDLTTGGGAKPRRYPIDLETTCLERDEFTIELPEGFVPEGPFAPADLDAGFAAYKSAAEMSGRTLVYRREYRLLEPRLPAARFDEVRRFFLAVGADERQSMLLKTPASRRA
jgi:hypothetical protein